MSCIFCKIIRGEVETKKVYEDELVLAFNDVNPLAPVHLLIIPKKHIESVNDLDDELLAGRMLVVAKELAKKKGIDQDGYKLLMRVGDDGGQEVPHIHLHLIGGAPLAERIKPLVEDED